MKTVNSQPTNLISPIAALIDLSLFLALMFFVRTIHIESLGFWGNAIFKSVTTVGLATLLLYLRKQSWKDLGLTKPASYRRLFVISAITLIGTIISIMIFQIFFADLLPNGSESIVSSQVDKTESTVGMVVSIMAVVWLESFLEELQDRGFSLNRFESLFSKVPLSAVIAVLMQAAIFGFRHSYDLSERSVMTGLIGLIFGIAYVVSGRNLWPLIIAHIILNTISMADRF